MCLPFHKSLALALSSLVATKRATPFMQRTFLRNVLCVNGNVTWCCNSTCIEQVFPVGARNEGYFYAVSMRPVLSQLILLGIITDEYARFFWQVFYGRYCEILQRQTQASF